MAARVLTMALAAIAAMTVYRQLWESPGMGAPPGACGHDLAVCVRQLEAVGAQADTHARALEETREAVLRLEAAVDEAGSAAATAVSALEGCQRDALAAASSATAALEGCQRDAAAAAQSQSASEDTCAARLGEAATADAQAMRAANLRILQERASPDGAAPADEVATGPDPDSAHPMWQALCMRTGDQELVSAERLAYAVTAVAAGWLAAPQLLWLDLLTVTVLAAPVARTDICHGIAVAQHLPGTWAGLDGLRSWAPGALAVALFKHGGSYRTERLSVVATWVALAAIRRTTRSRLLVLAIALLHLLSPVLPLVAAAALVLGAPRRRTESGSGVPALAAQLSKADGGTYSNGDAGTLPLLPPPLAPQSETVPQSQPETATAAAVPIEDDLDISLEGPTGSQTDLPAVPAAATASTAEAATEAAPPAPTAARGAVAAIAPQTPARAILTRPAPPTVRESGSSYADLRPTETWPTPQHERMAVHRFFGDAPPSELFLSP